jgi:hypothetical protein
VVDINIEETIAQSLRASVENYLQNTDLNTIIAETLQKQINNVVLNLTSKIFNDIVGKRDLSAEVSALINGILHDQLVTVGKNQMLEVLRGTDMQQLIMNSVQTEVHKVAGSYEFPVGSIPITSISIPPNSINGDAINEGKLTNFASTGIYDQASKIQLTITDEGIITTNNISAENLLIAGSSFVKDLEIEGEFSLTGNIKPTPEFDNYILRIANNAAGNLLESYNLSNIDLQNRNIVFGDRLILNGDTLGPQIINSNIRRLGNLTELSVAGQAIIHETLVVTNNKVGINTESASGALSVWDQDAEFTLIKHSPKTMYAGSTRITDIVLGSNNQEQIGLRTNGTIELNGPIRFGGLLINIVDRVPERIGEPGEIAIMRDGSAIYRCQGQNSWGKIL